MEKEIKDKIKSALSQSDKNKNIRSDIFHNLIDLFITHFEKPAHNITELKSRTTKMKGDIFETFCKMYLEYKGYEVWFTPDLPSELMKSFGLTVKDYGIDLVAKKGERWYAVQCKYRKPSKNSLGQDVHRINWKDISTFLSLVTRTGPAGGWTKHIIMTNADYVSWKGKKGEKDLTIAKKSFEGITREEWGKWVGYSGNRLSDEKKEEKKEENIRDLRKEWLDRMFKSE